jgi:hypothetical protein
MMTTAARLFPTPKELEQHGRSRRFDAAAGIALRTVGSGDFARAREVIADELVKAFSRVRIYDVPTENAAWELRLALGFRRPEPEAYRLVIAGNVIEITGAAWRGLLCGWATLRQLLAPESGAPSTLRDTEITDWPDIRCRAASRWLVLLEGTGMAYDWGNGSTDTFRRYRDKIDFAMRHKINFAFFEGFSFDLDKYPGYAADLRALNRYAADRNVRLEYGIHGIGVGGRHPEYHDVIHCGFVRGLGDLNRRSYPGGEPYKCMGWKEDHPTRYNGSCRSNAALNRLKQRQLVDFVSQVQPRALYIHHEDVGLTRLGKDWLFRCDECRKRWPDDEPLSEKGTIGAVVYGMNLLCEALATVKDPASGYDAGRDCSLVFVPPGYGGGEMSGEEWRKVLSMYEMISRLLVPGDNICICCREMYDAPGGKSLCIDEIAEVVHRYGHKLFLFSINGADSFLNDAIFTPGASYNGYFRAADAVFNFAGTIFQETQEAYNAECCWNLPPLPEKFTAVPGPYKRPLRFYETPKEFFARDGFVRRFAEAFYGRAAGKWMVKILKLRHGSGEGSLYPLLLLGCTMFKEPHGVFDRTSSLKEADCPKQLRDWRIMEKLTRRALAYAEAMAREEMPAERRETVARMVKSFGFALRIAELHVGIFSPHRDRKLLKRRLAECRRFVRCSFGNDFLAPGDDPESRKRYMDNLARVLDDAANFRSADR